MFLSPGARFRARPSRFAFPPKTVSSAYSLWQQDNHQQIVLGGGSQFTVSLGPAQNFPFNFAVTLLNADTRGKRISPTGSSSFILWPSQVVVLYRQGSSWQVDPVGPQRYRTPSALNLFVDPTNGNDNNDGLASGTSALATIGQAVNIIYQQVDCNNLQPTVNVASGSTVAETINIFGQMTGYNVLLIQGNGGAFTWNAASGSAANCIQVGDNAEIGLTNITFSELTGNGNYAHIYGHQYGVVDLNTGITFGTANGTRCVYWDYNGQLNVNNGVTYTGAFSNLYHLNGSTTMNLNGTQTASSVSSVARFAYLTDGSLMDIAGNVSFSTGYTGISAMNVGNGAIVRNSGGVVLTNIGGVPTPANGGIYSTAV